MIEDLYNEFLRFQYYGKIDELINTFEKKYNYLFDKPPIDITIVQNDINIDKLHAKYLSSRKKYNINAHNSFNFYLMNLIREKNFTAQYIQRETGIDKSQYYNIIGAKNNGKPYIPPKDALIKIAFAIQLSSEETFILLTKAGRSFINNDIMLKSEITSSNSNPYEINETDYMCMFLLEQKIYDFDIINEMLKKEKLSLSKK